MRARALWIAFAFAPLAIAIGSAFFQWRVLDGRAAWLGYIIYAFAALVAMLNFYLSFVRYGLHRLRHRSAETYKHISGFPVVGDASVVALLLVPASALVSVATVCLMLLDTGSFFWFGVAILRDPSFR